MCKRNTRDPLIRWLLEKYGLNLLKIPRSDAAIGDLYVELDGRVSTPGAIRHLLTPDFTLPSITKNEHLSDLSGRFSRSIDLDVSIGFLENFWLAITGGAVFALDSLKAAFNQKSVSHLRLAIQSATRDRVDVLEFGKALIGYQLLSQHPIIHPKNRYYVTTAVVRTPSIIVLSEDMQGQGVDADIETLKMLGADVGIAVQRAGVAQISFKGTLPLAIGIELYELMFNLETGNVALRVPDDYIATRSSERLTPSLIGDPILGDAFVTVF